MLCGIPYHAALMFSSRWGPPQGVESQFCELLAQVFHLFRMDAFFVIAGFFAAMLLAKEQRDVWLRRRLVRLAVPLITAALIVLPLQAAIVPVSQGLTLPDIMAFVGAHMFGSPLAWVDYLWFLYELIIDSALIVAAWPMLVRIRDIRAPEAVGASPFLAIFVAVGMAAVPLAYVDPLLTRTIAGFLLNRMLDDIVFFTLGAVLFLQREIFHDWLTWRWSRLAVALSLLVAAVALSRNGDHYRIALLVGWFAAVGGTWMVLAAMKRWGDAPSSSVKLFVDASLTIYLVHHPIIRALGLLTARTTLPAEVEWLAVCVATLALSMGFYLVIRQLPAVFFLFNGRALAKSKLQVTAGSIRQDVADSRPQRQGGLAPASRSAALKRDVQSLPNDQQR